MRTRRISAALGLVLLAAAVAGCGGGDGERPDVTLPSTTTTDAGAAGGSTTSTIEGTTTTEATTSTSEETTTTRPSITVTTRPDEPTTTTAEVTTTTEAVTTTTAAEATDTAAAPPVDANDDAGTSWWWLLIVLVLALIGFLIWRRSKSAPPWTERATAFSTEVDAAGRSVLLGPELTDELWVAALTRSNAVRAQADDLLDHAPTSAARQAVSEAAEALRQAEVQATAARSGVGGTGDRDAAAAELAAAVQRLQAVATPPVTPTP